MAGTGTVVVLLVLLGAACAFEPELSPDAHVFADGLTVSLGVMTCNADLTAEVEETESQVIVTITAQNDTQDDCADSIRVPLPSPVGDREVINGATGDTMKILPRMTARAEGCIALDFGARRLPGSQPSSPSSLPSRVSVRRGRTSG